MSVRGIFFVDLDGTLVGPAGIAERVWAPLAELRAAGWRLGVCTGRPGRGIALDVARRIDPDGISVFESGGVVMRASGEVLARSPLSPEAVGRIAALSRAWGATLEAYTDDGRYLVAERDAYIAAHEELLGFAAEVVSWPPTAPLVRMQWVVGHDHWAHMRPLAAEVLTSVSAHEGRSPKMPGVSFVSMTAPGTSKGTGIRQVQALLGVARADCAMAGDNLNDLDAFAEVATVFCAADGAPEALARAHHIVPGPADGGVADAAMHLLRGHRA